MNQKDKDFFALLLSKWYQKNKRDLPWRKDQDPYHVWISEIMLQQTRVEAVIPYYQRFLKAFSTIYDLAEKEEDILLTQISKKSPTSKVEG